MFVPVVDENDADGELEAVYEKARQRFGFVPDAVRVMSIRPEVAAAMERLRSVVLGDASTLGARRANLIGVAISGMNHCQYCGTAHAGLLVKGGDFEQDEAVQVYQDWTTVDLSEADRAMLRFAEKLTFTAADVTQSDIDELRSHGFSDVNVFDIVLLAAYRNFLNRIHDGLGVSTQRLVDRFGDDLVSAIAGL
jgi:uncharacterized peroxidase-related enzyme